MPRRITPLMIVLWGLVLLALLALAWVRMVEPRMTQTLSDTIGQGDYELVTTDGEPFTEETLRGTPSAVFFGFTHCPDVCPTTMGDIMTWKDAVEGEFNAYLVTIDPERDTAEVLGDYVGWAEGITGVTGSPEAVEEAIADFRVYARRVPLDEGGYTMDHSSSVLLFDEDGRFFEPIGYGEGPERAIAKIERLIGS